MLKSISYSITAVAICVAIVLYLYALFFYRFAFNYETDINGQYFVILIAVTGLSIIWGLNIFRNDYISNKIPYFLPIGITLLLLVLVFSIKYGFANEYWVMVLSMFILYACLMFLPKRIVVMAPYFLVVLLLSQLWLAFEQMRGFAFNVDPLTIQGSLQNSGVFSCYLVIHLPLLYYLAFQQLNPKGKYSVVKWIKAICFLIIVVFIGLIVYRSQSRSAIIGIAAAISLFFFIHSGFIKKYLQQLPKRVIIVSTILILFAMFYVAWQLFFFKKTSAFGRVMKWEIAGQHINDYFFTGTGIGRFSWYYPQWQEQYFRTNPYPPKEYFLSAGESYIIFNEYLQLFETIGLIGFAGFVLLLYSFFKASSARYEQLLSALKATMITLLATGLTTYVFHINVLLIIMAICFASVSAIRDNPVFRIKIKPIRLRITKFISVLLFSLSVYAAHYAFTQWQAEKKWNVIREGWAADEAATWAKLNKSLNYDGKFLTEYGQWLLQNGNTKEAVEKLKNAKQYFISRAAIETLEQAYSLQQNYAAAIKESEWLCNFLPNSFVTKYELLKLYEKIDDTAGIKKTADKILTMPVKIPSADVDKIKEETRRTLNNKPVELPISP